MMTDPKMRIDPNAPCGKLGCLDLAAWQPIVVLRAEADGYDPERPPTTLLLRMGVCQAHRLDLEQRFQAGTLAVPDERTWGNICYQLATHGRNIPDRGLTVLQFRAVGDPAVSSGVSQGETPLQC